MTIIPIELSVQGVNKAIRELERYRREIKPKMDEVCRRLAEIGRETAQRIFDDPEVMKDGNAPTEVSVDAIPNGYAILANGRSVYFIEFGTGNQASLHFDPDVPVAWGTYSAENKQMLWTQGFWYYGGEKLEGTPVYAPMFYAEKAMRENVKRVVEEVFGTT